MGPLVSSASWVCSLRCSFWQPDRQVEVIRFAYTWTAIGVLGDDYLPAFICLPGNHRHYAETLWLRCTIRVLLTFDHPTPVDNCLVGTEEADSNLQRCVGRIAESPT